MSLYDIEKFDPQPDPDLICCICQCVLHKAVESPCRHVFCQVCIEKWLSNRHTCPTCRKRTWKMDLKPVLPLVQNMLNRLLMKCDYYNNGCVKKIMLEHYENHIKDCGYEMKTCRFVKCAQKILKMNLEEHENELCEHRESFCEGECGLMVALSDRPNHNCVSALKAHIDEKNRIIDTLKAKLHELNNLSMRLNEQLEQLRQQLDENQPMNFSALLSSSESVVSDMSDDQLVSMDMDSSVSNDTIGNDNDNVDVDSTDDNIDRDIRNEAIDVVQQVERTVVSSLIDLSSRLERVRNQMRSVLDRGIMDEDNNLDDEVHIPSDALNAIVNNSNSAALGSSHVNNDNITNGQSVNNNNGGADAGHTEDRVFTGSEHRTGTEYSRTSFHSDFSDQDWSSNVTSTNQNDTRNYNQTSNFQGTTRSWLRSSYALSPQRTTQNWVQNVAQPSVHRATQNWVENVVQSPVHIIESQPPRSPSQSESSYSSIPTVSSIHSVWSGRIHDPDQSPHSSPHTIHSYMNEEPRTPQHSADIRSSLGSSIGSSSPSADRIYDTGTDIESDINNDNDRNTDIGTSSDASSDIGTVRGSSKDKLSNSESNHSDLPRNKAWHYTVESGDEVNHGSDNERSPLIYSQSPRKNLTPLTYDSDAVSTGSMRLNYSNDQSRDSCDNESKQSAHSTVESPQRDIKAFSNQNNGVTRTPLNGGNESLTQNHDNLFSPKLNESKSSTTLDYTSDNSMVLSDGSDPSDNGGNRRTWKYETNQPATRYDHGNKTITSGSEEPGEAVPLVTGQSGSNLVSSKKRIVSVEGSMVVDSSGNSSEKRVKQKGRSKKSSSQSDIDHKVTDSISEVSGNKMCNTTVNGNAVKTTETRKRRHDKSHEVTDTNKKSKNTSATGYSPAYNSQQCKQSSPRAESGQSNRKVRSSVGAQSSTQSHDKNTQSLNVKIDLSLINYSGNILTQPVSQAAPASGSTSGSTLIHSSASIAPQSYTTATTLRQPKSSFRSGDGPSHTGHTRQSSQRRIIRETVNSRSASVGMVDMHHSDVTNHREFPNLWCDDSDSDSDRTWEPDPGVHDTDVSLSDEGETESDTDYEVKIPKSTADLLQEYASDDTDESWTYGHDALD